MTRKLDNNQMRDKGRMQGVGERSTELCGLEDASLGGPEAGIPGSACWGTGNAG